MKRIKACDLIDIGLVDDIVFGSFLSKDVWRCKFRCVVPFGGNLTWSFLIILNKLLVILNAKHFLQIVLVGVARINAPKYSIGVNCFLLLNCYLV